MVYHLTVHFTGRVQGVGFRYSTTQVAREFDVSGFVQNLDDGRVLLEVEGERNVVRAFLDELNDNLGGFIKDTEIKEDEREPVLSGFVIR